jgi:hypothetical protein
VLKALNDMSEVEILPVSGKVVMRLTLYDESDAINTASVLVEELIATFPI